MSLLWLVLASYGLASTIAQGSIFRSLRLWLDKRAPRAGEFVKCPLCLGFWAGVFFGWVLEVGFPLIGAAPFVAAGASHFLSTIQRHFDIRLELEEDEQPQVKFL